jgi:hypothetical protein
MRAVQARGLDEIFFCLTEFLVFNKVRKVSLTGHVNTRDELPSRFYRSQPVTRRSPSPA